MQSKQTEDYFTWPKNDADHLAAWEQADQITSADEMPDWINGSEGWGEVRYLCNSSWAYVSAPNQAKYFAELEAAPDCIIRHNDDGDGCVNHFYVIKPDNVEPDHWAFIDDIN